MIMEERNKKLKLDDKEDRISSLPDSLIHHILSFFISTKEAIQTGILSKRWQNQWTQVPVLMFESRIYCNDTDDSIEEFVRFIDNTLLQHDCSKIKKLHLAYDFKKGSNFCSKIRFVTRKHVEELILDCGKDIGDPYLLPKFLLENASLVKLEMVSCYFMDDWKVNWGSLKTLRMEGYADRALVANILSGSPLLETLELNNIRIGDYVIDSKSLKILIFVEIDIDTPIEISCPNLEQLTLVGRTECYTLFSNKTIENVVSNCPLLHSLELKGCDFHQLVIASKSLKKLVLSSIYQSCPIEISCPNLEEFNFNGLTDTFKLMNSQSLNCATLDFEIPPCLEGCGEPQAKLMVEQLQNVKELSMGSSFIKILSDGEMRGLYYPWSNNKILTVDCPKLEYLPGIMSALRSSPALEKLVIKLHICQDGTNSYAFKENYWNSNTTVVNCLLPHLKIVEIIRLSPQNVKHELVFNFIKFLLKKARVLEKLVLVISKHEGTGFAFKVLQKVSSFPRCSQHAIVELLCAQQLLEMSNM